MGRRARRPGSGVRPRVTRRQGDHGRERRGVGAPAAADQGRGRRDPRRAQAPLPRGHRAQLGRSGARRPPDSSMRCWPSSVARSWSAARRCWSMAHSGPVSATSTARGSARAAAGTSASGPPAAAGRGWSRVLLPAALDSAAARGLADRRIAGGEPQAHAGAAHGLRGPGGRDRRGRASVSPGA